MGVGTGSGSTETGDRVLPLKQESLPFEALPGLDLVMPDPDSSGIFTSRTSSNRLLKRRYVHFLDK